MGRRFAKIQEDVMVARTEAAVVNVVLSCPVSGPYKRDECCFERELLS